MIHESCESEEYIDDIDSVKKSNCQLAIIVHLHFRVLHVYR